MFNISFLGDQTIDSGVHGAGANVAQGRKQQDLNLLDVGGTLRLRVSFFKLT